MGSVHLLSSWRPGRQGRVVGGEFRSGGSGNVPWATDVLQETDASRGSENEAVQTEKVRCPRKNRSKPPVLEGGGSPWNRSVKVMLWTQTWTYFTKRWEVSGHPLKSTYQVNLVTVLHETRTSQPRVWVRIFPPATSYIHVTKESNTFVSVGRQPSCPVHKRPIPIKGRNVWHPVEKEEPIHLLVTWNRRFSRREVRIKESSVGIFRPIIEGKVKGFEVISL